MTIRDTVTVTVEAAFGYAPAGYPYTWTDITVDAFTRANSIRWTRGRSQEDQQPSAGTATIAFHDTVSALDPSNPTGAYYGDLVPMVPIRAYLTISGTDYPLFLMYVERWSRTQRIAGVYTARSVDAVDAFGGYAAAALQTDHATLTTSLTGADNDLTFTAAKAGADKNDINIAYRNLGVSVPLEVQVPRINSIEVYPQTDGAGAITSTAVDVRDAVNAHPDASQLVKAEVASGNTGNGVVAAMTAQNLAGGEFNAELAGTRIGNVLDQISRPAGLRSLDAGASTIAAQGFDTEDDAKALAHLLDVASTDDGLYVIDGSGADLFIDRHSLIKPPRLTPAAVFSDNPGVGEIAYSDLVPVDDISDIVNDWTATRAGSDTKVRKFDQTSIDAYGPRSESRTSLVDSDDDLVYELQWRLARTKDPRTRISELKVTPGDDADAWAAVAGLEVGDRVTVKETPPGFAAVRTADYIIQQLNHQLNVDIVSSTFGFGLFPADAGGPYMIADDAVYGQADSGYKAAW